MHFKRKHSSVRPSQIEFIKIVFMYMSVSECAMVLIINYECNCHSTLGKSLKYQMNLRIYERVRINMGLKFATYIREIKIVTSKIILVKYYKFALIDNETSKSCISAMYLSSAIFSVLSLVRQYKTRPFLCK